MNISMESTKMNRPIKRYAASRQRRSHTVFMLKLEYIITGEIDVEEGHYKWYLDRFKHLELVDGEYK